MTRGTASMGLLLVTALLGGCAATDPGSRPAAAPADVGTVAGSLRDEGVHVTFAWASATPGRAVLTVRFTPEQPGFHLYGVDLPPDGIGGVGRPTRLEVGGGLSAVGAPLVGARTMSLRIKGIGAPLPVYPDGPVTLRQAVQVTSGRPALAWVSYAACSASTCLPPVTRHEVALALPGPR